MTYLMVGLRRFLPLVYAVFLLLTMPACGTVHPEGDFDEARTRIATRTGVAEVYDPTIGALVDEKVARLIENGLTADEAVRVALLNNTLFQARFYDIGASRADVVQSGLLSNPSLLLSVRFPQGGGRSNLGLGLAQELADLWRIPVRKRIAKEQLKGVVLGVVQSAIDLRAQVKTKYYELAALQQAEAVTRDNLHLVERSLTVARGRFAAGDSGLLDVNLARAGVLDIRMQLIAVQRDETTARTTLNRVLGLSAPHAGWRLADMLPESSSNFGDTASLLAIAMEQRLDIKVAAAELEGAKQEIRRQRRAVFPNISLGIDMERTDQRAPKSLPFNPLSTLPVRSSSLPTMSSPTPTTATDLSQFYSRRAQTGRELVRDYVADRIDAKRARKLEKEQSIDFIVGPSFQITLPIWDQNRAQIAKARFLALQKEKAFEALIESVLEDVGNTATTLNSATELVEFFTSEALPLARANVETARRTYEAGEESILALIATQQSLIQLRRVRVDVLRDRAVALADLERAVGGRLDTVIAGPVAFTEVIRAEETAT